ncbi:MAG: phage portal protein [Sphingopyxis sp.]|uniref:phage portal protein n=1 Tax=Sphingopyxis sp. TaxID=1908224 RepID=UPI001A6216D2|nr:phage portal protein [Sphingopyxis sp.]MBL9070422.1 phage portal protein [Sphingopyxis sp.]
MTVITRMGAAFTAARSALLGTNKRDAARRDISEMRGWNRRPGFAGNVSEADLDLILGRARDLDENNGWINGGLDRRVEAVIGGRIQLSAQPVYSILSRDINWRMDWSRKVQARFKVWGNDIERRCDTRQRLTFGALTKLAYLTYVRDGEACAEVRDDDRGLANPTNVLLVEPERISTPPEMVHLEGPLLRNGIVFNAGKAAIGAWVRSGHPDDPHAGLSAVRWDYIPFRSSTGRAKFIHVFAPRRAEQLRGISRLAEAMVPSKMVDRIDRAELAAALKSAIFSFFIKSPGTTDEVAEALAPGSGTESNDAWIADYLDYREKSPVWVENASVHHLFPGEDVVQPNRNSPNSNYPDFVRFVLQKIASSLGISYQQLSGDWASINYSSARALLNEIWRSILEDRHYFTQAFCTPIYAAWLEWEVANGDVKIPGGPVNFYRNKTAICMSEWIGPGRGSVDPNKESDAANKDTAAGRTSTIEHILERGRDPDDVLAEEAFYQAARAAMDLGPVNHNVKAGGMGTDGEGAGTEDDRDGDGEPNEQDKSRRRQKDQT